MTMIDLNADMGEYRNEQERTREDALMQEISSCSIACGGHIGDEQSMRYTIRSAQGNGVHIGAHPSYPDRDGFGRVSLEMDTSLLEMALKDQLIAIRNICAQENVALSHVKPHGALYNDAARNENLALMIAALVKQIIPGAALFGLPSSYLEKAAHAKNIPFVAEGFIDRLYDHDGSLTPRSRQGAVIEEEDKRIAQAISLARGDAITAADGSQISLQIQTLCIHSDSDGSDKTAKALRSAFENANIQIRPPLHEQR